MVTVASPDVHTMGNVMKQGDMLYSGKAKTVYRTDNPDYLIIHFRNDASAFDGEKKARLDRKGRVNNRFNAFIMQALEEAGIATHHDRLLSDTEVLVKHLQMVPVECVVRNYAAGSLCKRLGAQEGVVLSPAIFEFFYKDDSLHDPLINEYHIRTFDWADDDTVEAMKKVTFKVNTILKSMFADAGLLLVDFKLEFGFFQGQLLLGDEFSPDGCRVWDATTGKKLDKDRFRQDLGDVIESYEEIATRLGIALD